MRGLGDCEGTGGLSGNWGTVRGLGDCEGTGEL